MVSVSIYLRTRCTSRRANTDQTTFFRIPPRTRLDREKKFTFINLLIISVPRPWNASYSAYMYRVTARIRKLDSLKLISHRYVINLFVLQRHITIFPFVSSSRLSAATIRRHIKTPNKPKLRAIGFSTRIRYSSRRKKIIQ